MTAPACSCPTNAAGDVRCHVCGEYVNVRCWACGTPRGDGRCPTAGDGDTRVLAPMPTWGMP